MNSIPQADPGEPQRIDGRGKSPGSRKTQFRAGSDPRRHTRRKADKKPDPMLLLKRMRRDVRKADLSAFESKLEELKLVLGCLRPEPIQDTKPQQSQPAKELPLMLTWECPRCHQPTNVPRWYWEEHPGDSGMTHDCGLRIVWPKNMSELIQKTNPQTTEPAESPEKRKGPLHMICPGCRSAVSIDFSLSKPGDVLHHGCGARLRVGLGGQFIWF